MKLIRQPSSRAVIAILKERAMAKTAPAAVSPSRYRPNDELLAFLEGL
jgi:hypothetical protein